jgi:hypothetical protein
VSDDEFASAPPPRRGGRPRKGDAPVIDFDQLDKLLVYGELAPTDDGSGTTTVFPSYRQLGERFGVSYAVISEYAKKHNCMGRRERARLRTQLRVEEKMVEARAEAIAVTKDRELAIIDAYLLGFEKAIGEGRVRFDNPTDYNTMARLKEFLLGGADSRPEVHAALSLDTLQTRHRETKHVLLEATAAERGEPAVPVPALPTSESAAAPCSARDSLFGNMSPTADGGIVSEPPGRP